jgi:phytoene dehydrogenase-like protein
MCSPATHPGGGVSGLCGHNAAVIAMQDLKE